MLSKLSLFPIFFYIDRLIENGISSCYLIESSLWKIAKNSFHLNQSIKDAQVSINTMAIYNRKIDIFGIETLKYLCLRRYIFEIIPLW
jgi:hypothetical protein